MVRGSRLLTFGLLITFILLIGLGAFYLYNKYGRRSASPADAIPPNTGIYIKLNEPGKLIKDLASGNEIWDDLSLVKECDAMLRSLQAADSLLQQKGYNDFLENEAVYLAFAKDSGGLSSCIIFDWPYGASEEDLKTVARMLNGEKSDLHYAITRGLCIIGSNENILDACRRRLKNDDALPSAGMYEKVANTAGTNVDANIYINFEQFPSIASSLLSSSFLDGRQVLPHFGTWSEVDLLIKDDELLMNGYTEAIDSLDQFLGIFREQEAQKIAITRVLPYNTSTLISFGFSDYEVFYEDLGRFLQHREVYPERATELEKMKNRFGPNTEQFMTDWVGNELALATINPHMDDRASNTFLAIHAKDIEKAERQLSALASSQYNSTYRDYRIKRIPVPDLIPLIYSRLFAGIKNNYYTRIEDYIVFANSKKSLENFINIFLSGKTLEQNENFKSFVDNVSDRSNIFCYFNIRNSAEMLEKALQPPLSEFVARNMDMVKNFEALAVQFKTLNNMYFTSVYLKHNPSYIREDLSLWKAYLEAPVYGRPYFVKDHRTNNLKIVAFDTLNTMYLIDHEGNIDWKLNIGEKVISDVHTVDYYRNGKIQYLFNTANHIYLIDLLGRDVEGYPVALKEKATNGLSVFDYDNDRDYRILLALEDNRVYNFDIRGDKVDGWKNPLSKARVTTPVEHLRDGGKDYIIIADEEGNVRITDRRGRDRINLKTDFVNGVRSGFYVNETNSKGAILTTDQEGKLTYIKTNGRIEKTDFGEFSRDHYFLYEDFDLKGGKDFIYLDGNKLTVFDRFKNVMFSWEFENEINSSPVIIPVSSKEKIIGIVSENTGKIYLFDKNGNLLSTPDHIGKTQVLIGSLNRDGQLNMIVGSGNTIYNYYFR